MGCFYLSLGLSKCGRYVSVLDPYPTGIPIPLGIVSRVGSIISQCSQRSVIWKKKILMWAKSVLIWLFSHFYWQKCYGTRLAHDLDFFSLIVNSTRKSVFNVYRFLTLSQLWEMNKNDIFLPTTTTLVNIIMKSM